MRRRLLVLTAIATALALAPATSSAGEMKDSWLTTKAKMAMVKDDRVKARRVKVETQDGIVTLRGKVATVDEKSAAEEDLSPIAWLPTGPWGFRSRFGIQHYT